LIGKFNTDNPDAVGKKRVHLIYVLDRSGSMHDIWDEMVGSFRANISELKKEQEVEYFLSMYLFDHTFEAAYTNQPLPTVADNILSHYAPRGMTALYDAIGKALGNTVDELYDQTIVFVLTDGGENDSKEYTKDAVHTIIDKKLRKGTYAMNYLGSDPASWGDAKVHAGLASSAVNYSKQNIGDTINLVFKSTNLHAKSSNRGIVRGSTVSAYCSTSDMMAAGLSKYDGNNRVEFSSTDLKGKTGDVDPIPGA